MKRKILLTIVAIAFTVSVFAYDSPVGGERLFDFSSTNSLSGRNSVAGGALFTASPDSLFVNPALTASEQRTILNLAGTGIFSSNPDNDSKIGGAFQTGILIPNKMFIFSGIVNGTFVNFDELDLANSINIGASLSKEITEKLNIGLSSVIGLGWGHDTDWTLSANLGFLYRYGTLGFLKDFRYGATLSNLGKNYQDISHNTNENSFMEAWPGFATIKLGTAATLYEKDSLKIAASFDFITPLFQNMLFDLSCAFLIKDIFYINISEKLNLVEAIKGSPDCIPSIGIGFKFNFNVRNNAYLEHNGWSENEMLVNTAYRNLYGSANAISASTDIYLGMQDRTAPVIQLWNDEEE